MSLKLRYAFIPDPAVIEVSSGQSHEIDLQLIVSNPAVDPAELESVTIEIPVGDNTQRTLSEAPKLPAPTGQLGGWGCTVEASRLRLKPPVQIEEALVLTLPSIKVNEKPGTVPIKITEVASKASSTDKTTYSLTKVPDSFPITKFWAEPATLEEPDEKLTLRWEGDASASNYSYRVYTDEGWTAPGTCVSDGRCYTAADGKAGVAGPALIFGSAIHLDVVKTAVPPTVIGTATILVGIEEPTFSSAVGLERVPSLGGIVACMNWAARHTKQVTLKANGKTLTTDAPADTHSLRAGSAKGYRAVVEKPEAPTSFDVLAKLDSGSSYVEQHLGTLAAATPTQITQGVVAPSSCALGGSVCAFRAHEPVTPNLAPVTVFDLSNGTIWQTPVAYASFALSPDGTRLLCWGVQGGYEGLIFGPLDSYYLPGKRERVHLGDVSGAAFPLQESDRVFLFELRLSGPSKTVLMETSLSSWDPQRLSESCQELGSVPGTLLSEGRRSCGGRFCPSLAVKPAAGSPPVSQYLPPGTEAMVAGTPGGSLAAACEGKPAIQIIEMPTAKSTYIPLTVTANAVDLSPDGSIAVVASTPSNAVVFVDVANRRQIPGSLSAAAPSDVCLDNGRLAIAESNPPRITIWHATNEATRHAPSRAVS